MPPPQRAAPFAETLHHDIYSAISPDGTLANSVIGLTVVITGAGRGIGRAQALTFAKAGAKVVVLAARSTHELDEVEAAVGKAAPSTKVVKVTTDVSDEESVKRLFESVEEVHVLINNAGYMEPRKRIHEASTSDWWRAYEVNVKGTFLPTRQVIRIVLSRPQRPINLTIINTSSIASHLTSPGGSGYQTTKSVVNRFTEFVHFEYEAEGIRAFAYHPGAILTRMALDNIPPEIRKLLIDTLELAAGFALWLATAGSKVDFLRERYSDATWDVDELLARRHEVEEKGLFWTRVVGQEQLHA